MKDTIGILIAAVFAILLIVIFPLISIMDNQDNMAYNTVLTQATNYIDMVRTSGYITKDEYYDFLEKLSRTGNLYDINIEVHKPILIPQPQGGQTIYVEDTIIDNIIDIEKSIKDSNVYKLDVGDQIYLSIENSNIPSSSVIYRFIAGVSKYEIVDISYGGVVTKTESKEYDESTDIQNYIPQIVFGLPRNKKNEIEVTKLTNVTETMIEEGGVLKPSEIVNYTYQYIFDIDDEDNSEINIPVVLKNFTKCDGYEELSVATLKEYITLSGFTCGAKGNEFGIIDNNDGNAIKDDEQELTEINGEYRFIIRLTDIRMESIEGIASLSIEPRLGSNEKNGMTYYSSGRDTVMFYLINDYSKYGCEIIGPYNEDGTPIPIKNGKVTSFIGQDIYFNLNYKSISFENVYTFIDIIKSNLKVAEGTGAAYEIGDFLINDVGDEDHYRLADYDVDEAEINTELNYGTLKIHLNYQKAPVDALKAPVETRLYLEDKWLDITTTGVTAYNLSTPIEAGKVLSKYPLNSLQREERGYYVKPDEEPPTGQLKVLIKKDEEWVGAEYSDLSGVPKYLVGTSSIRLDTSEITDGDGITDGVNDETDGSGLASALLKNGATTIEYIEKKLEGNNTNKYFNWEVHSSPDLNVVTQVYYLLKDRAKNVTTSAARLDVYYETKAPGVEIIGIGRETKETYLGGEEEWYNEDIEVHLKLTEDYEFPYDLTINSVNTRKPSKKRDSKTEHINPEDQENLGISRKDISIYDLLGDNKKR